MMMQVQIQVLTCPVIPLDQTVPSLVSSHDNHSTCLHSIDSELLHAEVRMIIQFENLRV